MSTFLSATSPRTVRFLACAVAGLAALAGCGDDDATAAGPDAGVADAAPCMPSLKLTARFNVDSIGTGASSLDVLLGHDNSVVLDVHDPHLVRGFDPDRRLLYTAVLASSWAIDFTGPDGDLLDREVGRHLQRGGRLRQSILELRADRFPFIGFALLPEDTEEHPTFGFGCSEPTLPLDDRGYPVLQSGAYANCSVGFHDSRGLTDKNLSSDAIGTAIELAYQPCS